MGRFASEAKMADPIIVTSQTLEATFNEAASLYDGGGVFRESGQRLVDLLDLRPGLQVLDVATGAGAVLLPAARRVGPAGQVTGIDISANMLEKTRRAAAVEGLANVELLKMDGGYLQFPDASFDIATCGFGIFFLPETALKEMYRVCRPGGTVGLTVFDKTVVQERSSGEIFGQLTKDYGIELKFSMPLPASYAPEEIESLIAGHGFEQIETVQ
jgi:ubiquinone/menaquinone biosynthesis C-methylase UbiE